MSGSTVRSRLWLPAALVAGVALVAIAIRLSSGVLDTVVQFDERWSIVPILDLIEHGWSIRTAIDFEETKGPTMIWAYAILGGALGGELNDLRLVSVIFFVLGVVPLLLIADRLRLGRGATTMVAVLYILLPHHAVLGQLLMSESTFVCGALWLAWTFLWGFGDDTHAARRVGGPMLFGLLLALLLHHRVHAVAFAGAAALLSLHRDGWRSWPWWLAGALAGLSRVPLLLRWGGLVSPEYQSMHQSGLGLDAVTYLAAGLVPFTALFLWPALTDPDSRSRRWMIWAGAGLGLVLVIIAMPSLQEQVGFGDREFMRFKGFAATIVRTVSGAGPVQHALIGAMAITGMASLGGLASLALAAPIDAGRRVAARYTVATLLTGIGMYGLTSGFVFDRYLLPWAALLPITWATMLPRRALLIQTIGLTLIAAYQITRWL